MNKRGQDRLPITRPETETTEGTRRTSRDRNDRIDPSEGIAIPEIEPLTEGRIVTRRQLVTIRRRTNRTNHTLAATTHDVAEGKERRPPDRQPSNRNRTSRVGRPRARTVINRRFLIGSDGSRCSRSG